MKRFNCYVCGFYARDLGDFASVAYGLNPLKLKGYFEWVRETPEIYKLFYEKEDKRNVSLVDSLASDAYSSVFSFWLTVSGVEIVDSATKDYFKKFFIFDQVMTISGGYFIIGYR